MKLNLTVEGQILASIPISPSAINNDYYLKAFRRLLTLRHRQKLALLHKEPAFEIDSVPEKKGSQLSMPAIQ